MAAKKHRRRSGSFIWSLFTFCIVIGAIVAAVTVFLKVADVQVSGSTRYSAEDIVKTSGIETGDNMFMINKFEVANAILEEYPYIEQIKIRRKLPDTFTFEITERIAVAYVEVSRTRWLIDSNGYILEMVAKGEETKVPKVSGCEVVTPRAGSELVLKQEEQLPVLKEVLATLRYTGMYRDINRIEIGKLYDINLVYGNRFLVALGDTSSLSKKIEMLRAVIAELTDFDKGTINVSAVKEARFRPDANINLAEKTQATESNPTEETEKDTAIPDDSKSDSEKDNTADEENQGNTDV